jgi:hypothetical protein
LAGRGRLVFVAAVVGLLMALGDFSDLKSQVLDRRTPQHLHVFVLLASAVAHLTLQHLRNITNS